MDELKFKPTSRGFLAAEFTDRYGEKCSIQESSLATEAAIWFGIDRPIPKRFVPGTGWEEISLPDDTLLSGRMHLTQDQVAQLLPALQYFLETGRLPENSEQ